MGCDSRIGLTGNVSKLAKVFAKWQRLSRNRHKVRIRELERSCNSILRDVASVEGRLNNFIACTDGIDKQ